MNTLQSQAFPARTLGRTGLSVGAMGISASYGVPAAAVERAFEHGVNYLYWGSIRRRAFADAVRNLAPHRDRMVLVVQSYSRLASLLHHTVEHALRQLKMDHADVLLLGYWNHAIPPRILDAARSIKERGLVRFLAVSTHQRPLALAHANRADVDILHVRYNAVHRGAERDVFAKLAPEQRPGIVAFTATSWQQLLNAKHVAAGERVPTARDCYRFVLSNPAVNVCMSGPATAEHVDDVIDALDLGPMSADEMAWMRRIGDAKA